MVNVVQKGVIHKGLGVYVQFKQVIHEIFFNSIYLYPKQILMEGKVINGNNELKLT